MLLGNLYQQSINRLSAVSETPSLDTQVLFAHVLEKPRSWILAHPEIPLGDDQINALELSLSRLEAGEPLPYVLGAWEFYGLDFILTPDVLIPRPETELLVERALNWLKANPLRRLAVDVGTGSGCIAIALAAHIPDVSFLATDISLPALKVARANVVKHVLQERIACIQADLLPATKAKFDLVCANLPYIPKDVLTTLAVYCREPDLALNGGEGGLVWIQELLLQAPKQVAPGSLLLMEIEAGQGEVVSRLATSMFPKASVQLRPDLAGRHRLVEIQL